jgi:hypothetical protein
VVPPTPVRAADTSAAVVVAPRTSRDDSPARAPQVHIGSIEVTIAPPAPPRAALPAAPPAPTPAPPPPSPVQRLSRPSAAYGFAQE